MNQLNVQILFKRIHFAPAGLLHIIQRLLMVMIGAVIAALGYSLFQVPFNIVMGGVFGIAIFINHFTGWPAGTVYFVLNLPLLLMGYRSLGRWQFICSTVLAISVFSVAADLFVAYLPRVLTPPTLTSNMLLSTVYAGLVSGLGNGLIYRAGSTLGGTSIPGRILQQRTGFPLSQIYLYTDGAVIVLAGLVFGWEVALHGLLALFLSGMAADYIIEGPSSVRTAMIITNQPEKLIPALMEGLNRGVSQWDITGGYTGAPHTMLFCTVNRPQINDLKRIVARTDSQAFVIIGNAHQALGTGFLPLKP